MAIVIMGKTASGKTTIVNKLVEHGFHKIVTYTSRPIRPHEKEDIDYHFISEKQFKDNIDKNFFHEWKSYNTVDGIWYYGSSFIYEDNNSIIILTPDGIKDVMKSLPSDSKIIYIYANNSTIRNRLKKRGDNKEECDRRISHDNEDFKGAEVLADKIFYNNEGQDLNELINRIIDYIQN